MSEHSLLNLFTIEHFVTAAALPLENLSDPLKCSVQVMVFVSYIVSLSPFFNKTANRVKSIRNRFQKCLIATKNCCLNLSPPCLSHVLLTAEKSFWIRAELAADSPETLHTPATDREDARRGQRHSGEPSTLGRGRRTNSSRSRRQSS